MKEIVKGSLAIIISALIVSSLLLLSGIIIIPSDTGEDGFLTLPARKSPRQAVSSPAAEPASQPAQDSNIVAVAAPKLPVISIDNSAFEEELFQPSEMGFAKSTQSELALYFSKQTTLAGQLTKQDATEALQKQTALHLKTIRPVVEKNKNRAPLTIADSPLRYYVSARAIPEVEEFTPEIPSTLPKPSPKPNSEPQPRSVVMEIVVPKKTQLPGLTVHDLLASTQKAPLKTVGHLNLAFQNLQNQYPERNAEKLWEWVIRANSQKDNFELLIAEHYAEQKDLQATFLWHQKYAERTQRPEAIYLVGASQFFGRGTPRNYQLALENLHRAWKKGSPEAAYLCGIAQLRGLGTKKDEKKACATFDSAINMGSRLAFREAGRLQELGIGKSQNLHWAFHRYKQGAELGDPYCIRRLIQILTTGENNLCSVDRKGAKTWEVKKAAAKMDPIHFYVGSIMPHDFYTRRVSRHK